MNDLELDQQLQREGDRWRSAFPTSDTFAESLAVARQTRPHRAWLTPLIAAAAVVAVVAGTVLITRAGHQTKVVQPAGPVPWSSATVPAPKPTNAPVGTTGPLCDNMSEFRIGQLTSVEGQPSAVLRPKVLRIALLYLGASACRLTKATIGLSLLDQNGQLLDRTPVPGISTLGGDPGYPPSRSYEVEPGHMVIVAAEWLSSCSASDAPTQVRVGWPDQGTTLTTSLAAGDNPGCPTEDILIRPTLTLLEPAVVTPWSTDGLVAAIHAPATVHRGQTLNFSVTITNPTDRPISLDPCPTYTISQGGESSTRPVSVDDSYRLNCAQAPKSLAAGSSTEFEMQASVPLGGADNYSLTWTWGGQVAGDARGSSTTITVAP